MTIKDQRGAPLPGLVPERIFLRIGGEARMAADGPLVEDRAPATGQPITQVQEAGPGDVEVAVEVAREAQHAWAALGARERADRVHQLSALVTEGIDRLALLDAVDTGSPLQPMIADVRKGAALLHLYAGVALEMQGRTIPASADGMHLTLPEPWGVVAAITAYNHPLMFACMRAGPALVAGNAVILKPAEPTPLSSAALAELADQVLPPGVLTVLPGGPRIGQALVEHPGVPRVSFTGSVPTGRLVQAAAGRSGTFKSLTLELGGKNPIIVFPDVDPQEAAEAAVRGMNFTRVQGQSCGSTSRLLIHRDLHDQVIDLIADRVGAFRLGLPEDPDTDMGSLISAEHRDRVMGFIHAGLEEGARLVTGGGPPSGRRDLDGGAYVSPTVFDGVAPGSTLASREIFGPVLSVLSWSEEEEAIALANETEYGLTASVWTRDIDRALRVAARIEAGYIWINDVETRYPGVPFGGWKQSGIGTEQGLSEELLSYTRSKSLNIRVRPR